ncbi:fatty acid desaturase-domain-containing protein [Gymnopilus junonius]|uniref:Fatty acid desaturase-domain-containing protein n=1 Tax=Gymnopilus junonius TaxID=109634 RepID=A0A9P5NF09_GYMJU|nr:fatty acid desaturase-domain-containing protein [Gymnopilus junonius]
MGSAELQQSQTNRKKVFKPTDLSIKDFNGRVPSYLHQPNTPLGLYYFVRDLFCVGAFWYLGTLIDPLSSHLAKLGFSSAALITRWTLWPLYWFFQSLAMSALWVLGHECGHRAFSSSQAVCDAVGYVCHSFTGTPYFSWKITHHVHHSFHGSYERDSHHIPKTRSELGIPPEAPGKAVNYSEFIEDTPIYTISMLLVHQLIGFPLFLATNLGGQRSFPAFSSHYNPWATALFKPSQRFAIVASDIGIFSVIMACVYSSKFYGWLAVWKYYIIPWLGVNHWIMVIVYLQHTDPEIPHYRSGEWTYVRGAACTVDRPLLGELGRIFFHDVAHFHVAHHLFPRMPFYHTEEATKIIKEILGDHYLYHERYWIPNLLHSFQSCQFVEDEGQILFYKDKNGEAAVEVVGESN